MVYDDRDGPLTERIKPTDRKWKRPKPCSHCGAKGTDPCDKRCFQRKTVLDNTPQREIVAAQKACAKEFPHNTHVSEYQGGCKQA